MSHGVVLARLEIFFLLKSSNCFPLKPMFSECPSFLVLFVYNGGALNFHLHVVALSVSVTMS